MAFQSSHARSSNPSGNLRYWKSIPSDSYFSVASQSNSMVQQQISQQHGYNFPSVENQHTDNYPSTSGSYESNNNALTAQDFVLLRKRKRLESNTPPNKVKFLSSKFIIFFESTYLNVLFLLRKQLGILNQTKS